MPFSPRTSEQRFKRGIPKGRKEPEGIRVERRLGLSATIGHLDVMVITGSHGPIRLGADFLQLDLNAYGLPIFLRQLMQRRVTPLDSIDQMDDEWLAIGP